MLERKRRSVSAFVGLVAVAAAAPHAASCAVDDEARRVELVAQLERSAVVVIAEGRGIAHQGSLLGFEPSAGLGTGLVIKADGLVATAAHVVADAERVRVKVGEAEPVSARVVFLDDTADVALLRLDPGSSPLAPARLGDSDKVHKGETVYVIGNPVGIASSLSMGVVSGRHQLGRLFGGTLNVELIQTDAAMNSGNSGGPIFNSRGEVIALAQRIVSQGGGSQGLGFGLAINVVKKILGLDPCLWLGFSGVPLNDAWSGVLNVPEPGGLLVERVTPGGPADEAGLRGGKVPIQVGEEHLLVGGDVVLKIEGLPIAEWLRREPAAARTPGERHTVLLTVLRGGRTADISVATIHRETW